MSTLDRRRPFAVLVLAGAIAGVLAGCASLSPDGDASSLAALVGPRAAGLSPADAALAIDTSQASRELALRELLARQPLSADDAVRIALLNHPALQASLAQLRISDAQRVQAATLPNPHLTIGRLRDHASAESDLSIGINVLGVLTLPWRSEWASRQHEMARLQAAQDVVRIAADARKAWFRAVAARQSRQYAEQAHEAADAAAELARRMARAGNFSKYQQAREQSVRAETLAQLTRARQLETSEREQLLRRLGLADASLPLELPAQLPPLPAALPALTDIEARALRERLDVQASVLQARQTARQIGYTRVTGYANALDFKLIGTRTDDLASGLRERARGAELELPVPVFDWGRAATAGAQARYALATAQVQQTAVQARSEVREAWQGWRHAWDLARHYRDELVPLRRQITDETLLRYNGMIVGVFDLLAETRLTIAAVNASVDAWRDFWLIDTDLQTSLSSTSPGTGVPLRAGPPATAGAAAHTAKGH
ncbi:MAG: TolC family protein [Betaproteobacteria bacterium]|nr:TolC family protein [Betaproteobacteria bacterium]